MNSDKLKNNLDERENLSLSEQKISSLIGNLEKVSAPSDFEFRVKARMSAARANNSQASLRQTLRYALPLTATLVIAAFVLIQAGVFSSNQPPVGGDLAKVNQVQTPVENQNFLPSDTPIVQPTNSVAPEAANTTVAASNPPIRENANRNSKSANAEKKLAPSSPITKEDGFKGYNDTALKQSNVNISPAGIPTNNSGGTGAISQNNPVSADEIFGLVGIETEISGGKIKIRSVSENSLAGRSGVKPGDIIEAVDGKKLESKNSALPSNSVKTITISRDNKIQTIELKP